MEALNIHLLALITRNIPIKSYIWLSHTCTSLRVRLLHPEKGAVVIGSYQDPYKLGKFALAFSNLRLMKLLLPRISGEGLFLELCNSLKEAGRRNVIRMAKLLLENGADVNFRRIDRLFPLQRATERGIVPMVRFLMEHDKEKNQGDYNVALYCACRNDDVEIARLLLPRADPSNGVLLCNMLKQRRMDIVYLLLDDGRSDRSLAKTLFSGREDILDLLKSRKRRRIVSH